jgi:hypothetical protein
MLSDLRFVFRALGRNRGFTLVTVLTLALGIGSAASIFSVTDWVLFRANQFPRDVVLVGGQSEDHPFTPFRFEFMTRAYEGETRAFRAFAKALPRQGNVVVADQPVDTNWMAITPNLFPMLEVTPWKGRGFLPGEDADEAKKFFFAEYRLNHLLFTYSKPTAASWDGLTMGGGVGFSLPCT